MIHSFGEYPTALAAVSMAKDESAIAPLSLKKFFIFSKTNVPESIEKMFRNWRARKE